MGGHKISLKIDPPNIIPFLTPEKKRRNAIHLDYEAERLASNTQLNIKVVFTPITITRKRGRIQRDYITVGSTKAFVVVGAIDGTLRDYTKDQEVKITYSITKTDGTKDKLSFKPSVGLEIKEKIKADASLAEVSKGKKTEEASSAHFVGKEKQLTAHALFDQIRWTLKLPRGQKIFHDYLIGDCVLFATFYWNGLVKGNVTVYPADVGFFDSDKGRLGWIKSTLMEVRLKLNGFEPNYFEGIETRFDEIKA